VRFELFWWPCASRQDRTPRGNGYVKPISEPEDGLQRGQVSRGRRSSKWRGGLHGELHRAVGVSAAAAVRERATYGVRACTPRLASEVSRLGFSPASSSPAASVLPLLCTHPHVDTRPPEPVAASLDRLVWLARWNSLSQRRAPRGPWNFGKWIFQEQSPQITGVGAARGLSVKICIHRTVLETVVSWRIMGAGRIVESRRGAVAPRSPCPEGLNYEGVP
jgi:hypothetical protein